MPLLHWHDTFIPHGNPIPPSDTSTARSGRRMTCAPVPSPNAPSIPRVPQALGMLTSPAHSGMAPILSRRFVSCTMAARCSPMNPLAASPSSRIAAGTTTCEDNLPPGHSGHARQDSGGPDQQSRNFIRWDTRTGRYRIPGRRSEARVYSEELTYPQKLQHPATQLIRGVF